MAKKKPLFKIGPYRIERWGKRFRLYEEISREDQEPFIEGMGTVVHLECGKRMLRSQYYNDIEHAAYDDMCHGDITNEQYEQKVAKIERARERTQTPRFPFTTY